MLLDTRPHWEELSLTRPMAVRQEALARSAAKIIRSTSGQGRKMRDENHGCITGSRSIEPTEYEKKRLGAPGFSRVQSKLTFWMNICIEDPSLKTHNLPSQNHLGLQVQINMGKDALRPTPLGTQWHKAIIRFHSRFTGKNLKHCWHQTLARMWSDSCSQLLLVAKWHNLSGRQCGSFLEGVMESYHTI